MLKNPRPAGRSCRRRHFLPLNPVISMALIAGQALTLVACGLNDGQEAHGEPVAIRQYSSGGSVPPPARPEWKLQLAFDGESVLDYWPGRTYRDVRFPDWRLTFELSAEQKAGLRASLQAMDLPDGGLPHFAADTSVGGGEFRTEFQFAGGTLVLPGDAPMLGEAFDRGRRDLNVKIDAALPSGLFERLHRHAAAFQNFVAVDYAGSQDTAALQALAAHPLDPDMTAFSRCGASPGASPVDLARDPCLPLRVDGKTITLPSGAPGAIDDLGDPEQAHMRLNCSIQRQGDALSFAFEDLAEPRVHAFSKEPMQASRGRGTDVRSPQEARAGAPWRVWRQAGWEGLPDTHDAAMLSVFAFPSEQDGAGRSAIGVVGLSVQGGSVRYCLARYLAD